MDTDRGRLLRSERCGVALRLPSDREAPDRIVVRRVAATGRRCLHTVRLTESRQRCGGARRGGLANSGNAGPVIRGPGSQMARTPVNAVVPADRVVSGGAGPRRSRTRTWSCAPALASNLAGYPMVSTLFESMSWRGLVRGRTRDSIWMAITDLNHVADRNRRASTQLM